jgi:hypothetical protein
MPDNITDLLKLCINFPDQSPTWVFACKEILKNEEIPHQEISSFLKGWNSHGQENDAIYQVIEDQFLVIVSPNTVSGCSKDSLVRFIQSLEFLTSKSWFNPDLVFYKTQTTWKSSSRWGFAKKIKEENLTENTIVFDNTIHDLESLKKQGIIKKAKDSWHQQAFAFFNKETK